jgi:serine-type D-Ala-D-Ala carboxypeptidase/endopeptidase (penicillin-binding protein 4)
MKASDNYMAEMLTKNLAAEAQQRPVTIQAGLELIRQFMDQVGIPSHDYQLTSGAGYTQQNSISPEALCKVLRYLRSDDQIFPAFFSALPVAGVDGTLRYRMRKTLAQGRISAKTGYLEGVVGLAGFVNRPDGKVLTFAFMYNGHRPAWIVKNTFDRICVEIVK